MPRPRKPFKPTQWTIYVPEDLATKIDLFHMDPVLGKVRYGYRTTLVNKLLREWLEAQMKEEAKKQLDQRSFGGTQG